MAAVPPGLIDVMGYTAYLRQFFTSVQTVATLRDLAPSAWRIRLPRPRNGQPMLTRRNLPTWPRERRLRNPTRSHPPGAVRSVCSLALSRSRWSFELSTMAMAGTHER